MAMPPCLDRLFLAPILYIAVLAITMNNPELAAGSPPIVESSDLKLSGYIQKLIERSHSIPQDRRVLLAKAAASIRQTLAEHGKVDLIFVCTHNSRRSQLAQVWTALAAAHYQLDGIGSHSCGTEATACNIRTVSALERAGLAVTKADMGTNPSYTFAVGANRPSMRLFSKVFQHPSLPKKSFFAMMCCDEADRNCPIIPGAIQRIPLSYVDPKVSDDRPDESNVYDERCLQIATEMFELMKLVAADPS
jgi:arsenate reductase